MGVLNVSFSNNIIKFLQSIFSKLADYEPGILLTENF